MNTVKKFMQYSPLMLQGHITFQRSPFTNMVTPNPGMDK